MDQQRVLHQPFDIETHKKTFTNYLEVIITEDGTILYAVPSHQQRLIKLSCEKLGITNQELNDLCPEEYYFDFMHWLCLISGCVSLWNEYMIGTPNEKQTQIIKTLIENGLYYGRL